MEFWGPYTGFYLIENYKADFGGKNLTYRFCLNDPMRFRKSIRVTIEHGHANNYDNDYTSTAFWYQTEPHKAFPPLPSAQERMPRWPVEVVATLEEERKVGLEQRQMTLDGKVRLNPRDEELSQKLLADSNHAFRALRYQDYMQAVDALAALVKRKERTPGAK